LIALAEFVNAGNGNATSGVSFVLQNNGNVDGSGLYPIGFGSNTHESFQGLFNGQSVVIENLSITAFSNDGLGLFGSLKDATIENIIVSGVNIISTNSIIGSIAGFSDRSTISGVQVLGNIMINGADTLGGLVGRNLNSSLIINSYVTTISLNINGGDFLGGFVGQNNNSSSITNSYITTISLNINGGFYLGGFVAQNNNNSFITNSYFNSSILKVSGAYVLGGFVGENRNTSTITNSYVNLTSLDINGAGVFGGGVIGGFVGRNQRNDSSITNSYINTTNLVISAVSDSFGDGGGELGGFVGFNDKSSISNSYLIASGVYIEGTSDLGGFVGYNKSLSLILNSFAAVDALSISGVSQFGGFLGNNQNATVLNSLLSTRTTTLPSSSGDFDLFVGFQFGTITNSFFNEALTDLAWVSVNGGSVDGGNFQTNYGPGIDIGLVDATTLLDIINGSGAFQLTSQTPNEEYFPVLV
jgi:hypothetical protein